MKEHLKFLVSVILGFLIGKMLNDILSENIIIIRL